MKQVVGEARVLKLDLEIRHVVHATADDVTWTCLCRCASWLFDEIWTTNSWAETPFESAHGRAVQGDVARHRFDARGPSSWVLRCVVAELPDQLGERPGCGLGQW